MSEPEPQLAHTPRGSLHAGMYEMPFDGVPSSAVNQDLMPLLYSHGWSASSSRLPRLTRNVVLLALLFGLSSQTDAQTVLTGVVHGPRGQIVANAVVTAENEATGQRWSVLSSRDGVYQFVRLPPATYRVAIELEGFAPHATTGVVITGRLRVGLDIDLILSAKETLTVPADTEDARFRADSSGRPVTFTADDLALLPLASGRTLQSLQVRVPGILFTESTNLVQFTAAGQRRTTNRLVIDGVSADLAVDVRGPGIGEAASGALPATATSGGTQTLVPIEGIQEIQVHTMATTSDLARSSGAQTVVITRAGSDRIAGTAFGGLRPEGLAASDWFSNAGLAPKRENHFWNVGASLGGPIRRERLNYFVTWERQAANRPTTTTIEVPSMAVRAGVAPALRPLLDAYPLPNGSELADNLAEYTDEFPLQSLLWAASVRLDGQLSSRHRGFIRLNRGESAGDAVVQSPYQVPFFTYASKESAATTTGTAGWTAVLGNAATNALAVGVITHAGDWTNAAPEYGQARELPRADFIASGQLDDSWLFATLYPGPFGSIAAGRANASSQRQFQISDSFSMISGRHTWRFGGDYTRTNTATAAAPNRYVFRFAGLAALLQNRPVLGSLTTHRPAQLLRQSWSAFAQDTFRVMPHLTLDYGIRYSVQPAPSAIGSQPLLIDFAALPDLRFLPEGSRLWQTSWGRIAPRVGIAYRPTASDKTPSVIRGSWSLVFDELTNPGGIAVGRGYPYVTGRQAAIPQFPTLPAELLNPDLPVPFGRDDLSEYYAFPKDLRRPRTTEWQIAWDQKLGEGQRASASYVGAAGRNLIYWYGLPAGGTRLAVNAYSNDGESSYRALLLEYVARPLDGINGKLSYAWSRSVDTDSGEGPSANAPPHLISPGLNVGPSDFDRPHVLTMAGSLRAPRFGRLPESMRSALADWSLDLICTWRSGGPISPQESRLLGQGAYSLRPDAVADSPVWLPDNAAPGGRRLNPDAFAWTTEPRQGTARRNAIRMSPLTQVDVALSRSFRPVGRTTLQLRVEAFNLLNHPNFGVPQTLRTSPSFGRSYQSFADSMGTGTLAKGGLSPQQQLGGSRSVQIGVRLGL